MKGFLLIFRKEVGQYFRSPLAYILAALYAVVIGGLFYKLLTGFIQSSQLPEQFQGNLSLLSGLLRPLFGWINLISAFLTPFLCMRLFASEQKDGTLDLLLISPVGLGKIILGKFVAAFMLMSFLLALTLVFPLMLMLSGMNYGGIVATSYLGMLLNFLAYLSLGLFTSSLTKSQLLAALYHFVLLLFFFLVAWLGMDMTQPELSQLIRGFSLLVHYDSFSLGLIRSQDLLFYGSFVVFWLYLTQLNLRMRS